MNDINEIQTKKLFQEQPIIIFNSLINGYGQIHQQRPTTIHKFKKDIREKPTKKFNFYLYMFN